MGRWQDVFFSQPEFGETAGCVGSPQWRTHFRYDIVLRLLFIFGLPLLFYLASRARRLQIAQLYLLMMTCVCLSQLVGERVHDPSRCGPYNLPAGHVAFHVASCSLLFLACRRWLALVYAALSAAVLVSTCLGAYHSWLQLFAGAAVGVSIVLAHEWRGRVPRWAWVALGACMFVFATQMAFRQPLERWNIGGAAAYILYRAIKNN